MNDKVKHRRWGRPVKNKLADPIDDTTENVMKALLNAKPKATGFCYRIKSSKKKER